MARKDLENKRNSSAYERITERAKAIERSKAGAGIKPSEIKKNEELSAYERITARAQQIEWAKQRTAVSEKVSPSTKLETNKGQITSAPTVEEDEERNLWERAYDRVKASREQRVAALENTADYYKENAGKPTIGGYLGEKVIGNALETVEGNVNTAGYIQQILAKGYEMQAANALGHAGAVTGNAYIDAQAQKQRSEALEHLRTDTKTIANFGDRYVQKTEEKYADADFGKLTRFAGDVAGGFGGMAPVLAAKPVPILSDAILYAGAFGNAMQSAKKEGKSDAEAIPYAVGQAAVEYATEKMFSFMGGFGKGGLDDYAKKAIKNGVNNPAARSALTALVNFAGEGVEEFIAEYGGWFVDKLTVKIDERKFKELHPDAFRSALVGGILGGLLGAGEIVEAGQSVTPEQAAEKAAETAAAEIEGNVASDPEINNTLRQLAMEMQNPAQEVTSPKVGMDIPKAENAEISRQGAPGFEVDQSARATAENNMKQFADFDAYWKNLQERKAQAEYRERFAEGESVRSAIEAVKAIEAEERAAVNMRELERANAPEMTLRQRAEVARENVELANPIQEAAYEAGRQDAIMSKSTLETEANSEYTDINNKGQSKAYGKEENHIDNRTVETVAARGTKAFQFDHPELHQYYVEAAQTLINDAQNSLEEGKMAPRTGVDNYGHRKKGLSYQAPVSELLDKASRMDISRPQLIKALEDIIADNGQENYAAAKRAELLLDSMLSDGYTTSYGESVEPNSAYLSAKSAITGGQTEYQRRKAKLDSDYELVDMLEGAPNEIEQTRRQAEYAELKARYETEDVSNGTEERAQSGSRGEQRTSGMAAEERSGSVQGGAGSAETRGTSQKRRADGFRHIVQNSGIRKQSTASQGIGGGTNSETMYVLPAKLWTDELRTLSRQQSKNGRQVIYIVGEMEFRDEGGVFTARGAISRDGKRMWVRVDHDVLTPEQIIKHEEFHALAAKDSRLIQRLCERIINENKQAELNRRVMEYVNEYGWTNVDYEYVLEEVLADYYADIDIFDFVGNHETSELTDTVRDGASQSEAETSRNKSPPAEAKYSRETKKLAYEEKKIMERIRQDQIRRYMRENNGALPDVWCSSGEFFFYVYKNPSMMEYKTTTKIRLTDENMPRISAIEAEVKRSGSKADAGRETFNSWAFDFQSAKGTNNGDHVVVRNTDAAEGNDAVDGGARNSNRTHADKKSRGNQQEQLSARDNISDATKAYLDKRNKAKRIEHLEDRLKSGKLKPEQKTLIRQEIKRLKEEFQMPKFSRELPLEERKANNKAALDYFGRTFKWAETGYVLLDGSRLDFSGRHDGAPGGYRTVDHREIRDALGDDYGGEGHSGGLVQFMSEGNVRIMPECAGINLSVMPTKAQLDSLSDFVSRNRGEVMLDIDDLSGHTISSTEYPRGTHANKVIADIKKYFESGETPHVSELSQFRYSRDTKGTERTEEERKKLKEESEAIRSVIREELDRLGEEYGWIKAGENPAREVKVPRRTADDEKVSQTVRTILEAQATPDEALPKIEELIANGEFSYEVYGDEQAQTDAEEFIRNKGWDNALSEWLSDVRKGNVSKRNTATGWLLYDNAVNSGNVEQAMNILNAMVEHQRSAAQALQATRILKKLSPETQLYGVQRSVANLQQEINDRYGKKTEVELKVDEELAQKFVEAQTEEERNEALIAIYKDIGRQMPSTFEDKFRAFRYLSMLTNPRTHVRNLLGNAFFMPVVLTKDVAATVIEGAVHFVSGGKTQRSKSLAISRDLLSAAWNDFPNAAGMVSGEGKYNDYANANKYIEEGRQIFKKNKPLEAVRKANSTALETEDMWFSKPHYAFALAQYCKAHGITADQLRRGKALGAAREYAVKEAQKATYRDTNALSQAISQIGFKKVDDNIVKKGVNAALEGVLPFRKTPANILVRGIEYSPLGLLNGVKQAIWDVKRGNKTSAEAIDSISAGLTGTGLLALGMYWAAQGLIRGHGGDDEKEKEFEEMMGHQSYALELPNGKSYTLDWLAPEALPFFIGVNLYELIQSRREDEEKMMFKDVLSAVANVTEPMLEMSCLQSLNDLFEAVGFASSNDMNALVTVLSTAATSYLTQALPTVLGQVERSGQGERMTTYTEKDSQLSNDMQYFFGKVSAKVPGWDYNQIPYIDAWGRTESTGGVGKRIGDNFLNPAYTSQIETSAMEEELLRLYEETGEASVLPSRAGKYFNVDKVRKDLTAEEYVKYATEKGQMSYQMLTSLVSSSAYQQLDDALKVEAIGKVYDYANVVAKMAVSEYEPTSAEKWVTKAIKTGGSTGLKAEQYIVLYNAANDVEALKDAKGESIDLSRSLLVMQMIYNTPGLTEKQRQALFADFGVSDKVIHYNKSLVNDKIAEMKRKAK